MKALRSEGYWDQILLSHDGNSMRLSGRTPKAYDQMFIEFIPLLKSEGFTDREIEQLTVRNPGKAFTISRRLLPRAND